MDANSLFPYQYPLILPTYGLVTNELFQTGRDDVNGLQSNVLLQNTKASVHEEAFNAEALY